MPWWWPLVTFFLGSGGVFTIVWFLFTRRINKADQKKAAEKEEADKAAQVKADANQREWLLVKAYRQKLGRVLFWMITELLAIIEKIGHRPIDGHLQSAWEAFEKSEAYLKQFEDEQSSRLHKD